MANTFYSFIDKFCKKEETNKEDTITQHTHGETTLVKLSVLDLQLLLTLDHSLMSLISRPSKLLISRRVLYTAITC